MIVKTKRETTCKVPSLGRAAAAQNEKSHLHPRLGVEGMLQRQALNLDPPQATRRKADRSQELTEYSLM